MRRKYKHIFFDLDNTLWDFERNSKNAMKMAFAHFFRDSQTPFEDFFEVYSNINNQLWNEYKRRTIIKKDLIHQRFQKTFLECDLSEVKPEEMNRFYLEEMAKQKVLKKGALEIIQYLKNKNYVLHIITNGFKEVQFKKLETSGLSLFFNKIFVSEDVKVPKPGYEIFEYAVKSTNAKKGESLMIGDDWEVDIVGANLFGLDAVYIPLKKKDLGKGIKVESVRKNKIYSIDEIVQLKELL